MPSRGCSGGVATKLGDCIRAKEWTIRNSKDSEKGPWCLILGDEIVWKPWLASSGFYSNKYQPVEVKIMIIKECKAGVRRFQDLHRIIKWRFIYIHAHSFIQTNYYYYYYYYYYYSLRLVFFSGVMAARGILSNPAMYAGYDSTPLQCVTDWVWISVLKLTAKCKECNTPNA